MQIWRFYVSCSQKPLWRSFYTIWTGGVKVVANRSLQVLDLKLLGWVLKSWIGGSCWNISISKKSEDLGVEFGNFCKFMNNRVIQFVYFYLIVDFFFFEISIPLIFLMSLYLCILFIFHYVWYWRLLH